MNLKEWLRTYLPTVQGRLLAGIAFAVAITVGLWNGHDHPLDPAKAFAVLTTGLLWLFTELGGLSKPSDHDIALYKKIFEVLHDQQKSFLRNHDFGNGYYKGNIDGLWEASYWDGVSYQFNDTALESRWGPIKSSIDKLSENIARKTWPAEGNPDWRSAVGPEHNEWEWPDHITANVDLLNTSATELIGLLEDFQVFGRKRLGL